MSQATTITFFKFSSWQNQLWAFSMMKKAHPVLSKVKGQLFYKLMASGRGSGFNILPDTSTFALLQVWKSHEDALSFFGSSSTMLEYRKRSTEIWTTFMTNLTARGEWGGESPFEPDEDQHVPGPLVVLTRATVRWQKLLPFWQQVPASHQSLASNKGLIYTKGIGEVPILQMATISIWKDEASLRTFAYNSPGHRNAILKAKEHKWFKEEMFARFSPYLSVGTWNGKNMLPQLSQVFTDA